MRVIILVILAVFLFTLTAYSQLTDDDLAKIRLIVKTENSKIKAEITAIELRITQQIQESENRLRSELNQQLNARIHDFTIVFGIISGGFFLLFASVLLVNALKGRAIINKGTNTILIIASISTLLSLATAAIAYDHNLGHITCSGITITDNKNRPKIKLQAERFPKISMYGRNTRNPLAILEADIFGGTLTLKSNTDAVPNSKDKTRIHLKTSLGTTLITMGEEKSIGEANGITFATLPDGNSAIIAKDNNLEYPIHPKK